LALLKPADVIIIFLIVAFAGASFTFPPQNAGEKFVVSHDGKIILEGELSKDSEYSINGSLGEMKLLVRDGKISVVKSNCSRKLCIKRGSIAKQGESIICVPNRVIITIQGKGKVDGITG